MWKMSDVESLWDVHFYIEQRDEVPLGFVEPIDLDEIPEVLLIDSDDDAPIEEITTQVEPIVEPIVSNIQVQRLKKLVTKPSDDEVIVENVDVGGNTVGEGVEDMGGNTVDGEHRGGVGDMGINTDNWSELDPNNLNAEEGYNSTHTSQDGDDGPTQENIDRCDLEFIDLAKEYDNIFAEEEDAVHSDNAWLTGSFVSEYYKVSSYVKTYKYVIYPVVDPSEWGHPQPPYFIPPPLVREPGRPRKERIHDPDEKRPHKRCSTCRCFGHSKTACKGSPVVPTARVVRTRQKLDTNTNRANFIINISLQVDAGGERDAGGARGGGRTGRNTVGGRTSIRRGRGGGGARCGARGGARGRAKKNFQAPRQSKGVTQVSSSQAPRHSQGDTQVSQSQVRAQNQQSQAQASSSNPYKKEFVQPRRKWI
ncbi:hypothetical protein GIB67_028241 [Kingdonia uniflora]|uniref:Uncharacterized protein n=1 Tax=Kingdonia uniflora TaxID=39325 RepID=A0A7J7KZ61_9MAGN|nr:hypothetical protein GIB67_028241 [Kingdonia uniflora]